MTFKPYPKYKASGVEWLGDVPDGWAVQRLRWSAQNTKGGVWGNEPAGDANDLVCIRVADFNRDQLRVNVNNLTTRNISTSEQNGRLLFSGDLLLEKSGGGENQPVGCVIQYDQEFPAICSNFINRIVPSKVVISNFFKFVHASLYALRLTTRSINQTSGIQNLDTDRYFTEHVGYPPLHEQSAIADFLDRETAKIDTLIGKQEAMIGLLKEKRKAVISHAVTKGIDPSVRMKVSGVEWLGEVPEHWKMTALKYASSMVVDCPHETPVYSPDGEFLVIRTADVSAAKLTLDTAYRLDEEEYLRRTRRSVLLSNDIVYGREGERWGFAALVPQAPLMCLGQRMIQIRAAPEYDAAFLMWALNSDGVYQQGKVDVVGATAPHVNVETIRNYRMAEPPVEEQKEIASFLANATGKVDALIAKAQRAIALQKEHRTALISAAVTGKIDVRGKFVEKLAA